MAFQIFLNLIIGFLWMFLHNDWTIHRFIIGYLIGMIQFLLLYQVWPDKLYLFRIWAAFKLLILFIRELVKSSVDVIRHIMQPKLTNRPGIFAYQTELKSDWEVTLLACLICLTPGTVTVEFSRRHRTLYIHAMDIEEVEVLSAQIKGTFEKAIQKITC